jgi:hypothetical protein
MTRTRTFPHPALLVAISLAISSCTLVRTNPPPPGVTNAAPLPVLNGPGFSEQYSTAVPPGEYCMSYGDVFAHHDYWCMRDNKVVFFKTGDAATSDPGAVDIGYPGFWRFVLLFSLFPYVNNN